MALRFLDDPPEDEVQPEPKVSPGERAAQLAAEIGVPWLGEMIAGGAEIHRGGGQEHLTQILKGLKFYDPVWALPKPARADLPVVWNTKEAPHPLFAELQNLAPWFAWVIRSEPLANKIMVYATWDGYTVEIAITERLGQVADAKEVVSHMTHLIQQKMASQVGHIAYRSPSRWP